jgi:hypothetical protein
MEIAGARLQCRIFTAVGVWDGREESIGSVVVDFTLQGLVVIHIGTLGSSGSSCRFAAQIDRSFVHLAPEPAHVCYLDQEPYY